MSIDFEEMFPSKNHPWLFDAWLAFVSLISLADILHTKNT